MTALPTTENVEKSSGFAFLIGKFECLEETPKLHDICGWLAEAEISDDEIMPYRVFSDEKYTRNRVFRNEFIEMLVLGWTPGQESLIHDHDGSVGAVRVMEGEMTEVKFKWDTDGALIEGSRQNVTAGLIAGVGEPDIHQLAGAEGQHSITIHVYAPPLEGLNIYDLGSREIRYFLLN